MILQLTFYRLHSELRPATYRCLMGAPGDKCRLSVGKRWIFVGNIDMSVMMGVVGDFIGRSGPRWAFLGLLSP